MNRPRAHVALMPVFIAACVLLTAGAQAADQKTKIDEKKSSATSLEGKPAPEITQAAAMPPSGIIGEAAPDLRDKIAVLFFFPDPKEDDSVAECVGFRDLLDQSKDSKPIIVGICPAPLMIPRRLIKHEKLNFPVIADGTKEISHQYNALGKEGRANRVTFVIDKKGIIRKVFEVKDAKRHPQEVFDYVKTMK